jgi:hypothetical protein
MSIKSHLIPINKHTFVLNLLKVLLYLRSEPLDGVQVGDELGTGENEGRCA